MPMHWLSYPVVPETATSVQKSKSTSTGGAFNIGSSQQQSTSDQQSTSKGQSSSQAFSTSYIPEYSQTPILEGIAKYAQKMAPEVYEWGMTQFNKNQGQIDNMMKDAMSYASPQRVAQEMGMAQAGVMQGAEQGRQNAVRDLESLGIDPSSGRYAALDTANRTMAGAMAAGAGNQQRMATEAQASGMKNQAMSASLQNNQLGYGASNAMNQLLGTGMQLQYSPLGTTSSSTSNASNELQSTGTSQSTGSSSNYGMSNQGTTSESYGASEKVGQHAIDPRWTTNPASSPAMMAGGAGFAEGGHVPEEVSRSDGEVIDDVPANLTAGEFIIPRDIVEWKGQEFFYKLMAQSRKMRATSGGEPAHMGYGAN